MVCDNFLLLLVLLLVFFCYFIINIVINNIVFFKKNLVFLILIVIREFFVKRVRFNFDLNELIVVYIDGVVFGNGKRYVVVGIGVYFGVGDFRNIFKCFLGFL